MENSANEVVKKYNDMDWQEKNKYMEKEVERMDMELIQMGGVARDLTYARREAREIIKNDGLKGKDSEYGGTEYTSEQGLRASILTRYDVAMISYLQGKHLSHNYTIIKLLWGCLFFLALIAYKVYFR